MDVLAHLLTSPIATIPEGAPPLEDWLPTAVARAEATGLRTPIERAIATGFEADRLGFAFAGGYRAALSRLFENAARETGQHIGALPARVSLCATEQGGGHPRAITTKLEKLGGERILHGEKTFATLATIADELIVVATRGFGSDGKNLLRVVRVPRNAPGVTIEARPPTPFAPEIPHARVVFEGVAISDDKVLPGDGYGLWLKPFRTIEDTYVVAAALGHFVRCARLFAFERRFVEDASSLALTVLRVADEGPSSPALHVALAGVFRALRRLLDESAAEWTKAPEDVRARWERDQPLFMVADVVRQKRTEAAFTALGFA